MYRGYLLLFAAALIIFAAGSSFAEMSVSITNPKDGDYISPCGDFVVTFDIKTTTETIKEVRLYSNGLNKGVVRKAPWEYTWKALLRGSYRLQAKLVAQDGSEVWSEPVRFKSGPVSAGEKVVNGSFECDTKLTPWTLQAQQGAIAKATVVEEAYFDDANFLMVEIENGGSADWHIQLNQTIPTDSGHVYEIYFFADADVKKTISFMFQENQDPWAVQGSVGLEIDGANEYGPYEIISTRTDPSNVLRINLGNNTTTCYLDGFSIIDRSATSVKSKELGWNGAIVAEYELENAYPNPFNMNTTIPFTLSRDAEIKLAVYDLQGRHVRMLLDGAQSQGHHVVHWDGLNDQNRIVSGGVYFYRLQVQTGKEKPIQLSRKVILVK